MTRAWQGSMLAAMFSLAAPAWAQAPIQIVPPAAQTPPPKPLKPVHRPPPAKTAKPAAEPPGSPAPAKPKPQPSTSKSLALPYAAPGSGAAEPDLAYAAYDGGQYLTAFAEATRRVNNKGDPKAMTLLGELYANGFGVPKDDQKALAWFSLAVDRGDREAMFELAMLRLAARGGPRDCCAAPPTPAIPTRNMRWRRSTRRAAASPRMRARPRGCSAPRPAPATSTPRSNMPSLCSMGPGWPRTKPAR